MMPRFGCAGWVSGVALAACLTAPAFAEGRRALVIAETENDRATAVAMSEALLGLGFDVERLEAPTDANLDAAMDLLTAAKGPTVIYGGAARPQFESLVADAAAPLFLFLDACDLELPALPENVLTVTRGDCVDGFSEALLDQIAVPGLPTDQWVFAEGIDVTSTLEAPFVFRTPTSDVRLTPDDYAMLETLSPAARDQMIALWRKAGIAVDFVSTVAAVTTQPVEIARVAPVEPVAPAAVVRPVATQVVGATTTVSDNVSVVARPLVTSPEPAAPLSGLPQPSILVGYAVENLPDAPLVPNEPVAGAGFGSDDVTAREALRAQDAAAFEGLVAAGAFDPLEDDVARALQVELARINCYTSGIDGAWGPGSQRALLAFYEETGAVPPGSDADLEAFREVIARDDIRCPDVVPVPVAQPVAAAQPAEAPAPAQSTRAAVVTPQPAPAAPAPQPTQTRRSISQTGGTGVFR